MDKVKCLVCGKEFKQITNTHLKSHDIDASEYKTRFPDALLISEASLEKLKLANQEVNAKVKGKKRSIETIEKMKESIRKGFDQGREVWNKGSTLTEETKEKISITRKEKIRSGEILHPMIGKTHSEETKQKISSANTGRKLTEAQYKNLLIAKDRRLNSDDYVPPMLGKSHSDASKLKIGIASAVSNPNGKKCIANIRAICESEHIELISEEKQFVSFKCCKCENTFRFTKQLFNSSSTRDSQYCPYCFPRNTGTSNLEKEIGDFIESTGVKLLRNDRNSLRGKELDILVPEKNLAIEVTGLYWHSTAQNLDKNHLLNKKKFGATKGIKVITIYEDEWNQKPEIVKSRLLGLLGFHTDKISARKCQVVEVDPKTKNTFLEENHIQGQDRSTVNLGLRYSDKLVALATFKKTNMVKGGDGSQWELSRFCSILNTRVVGAAAKLITAFRRRVGFSVELISYADRRWSDGDVYRKIGFEFCGTSIPSYWYTSDFKNRIHRSAMMRHHLENKYGSDFCEGLTEEEIATKAGFFRIYDCGTTKWVLK